jgi:hypothetical protein
MDSERKLSDSRMFSTVSKQGTIRLIRAVVNSADVQRCGIHRSHILMPFCHRNTWQRVGRVAIVEPFERRYSLSLLEARAHFLSVLANFDLSSRPQICPILILLNMTSSS